MKSTDKLNQQTRKLGEPGDVHVDQTLTNISIKYMNEMFVGERLLPVVQVGKRSNKYWIYDRAEAFRLDDDTLGPKAMPNEIDMKQSTENYSVKSHGLADWVPQEEIDEADAPLQPQVDATENLREKLMLGRESRIATLVRDPNTYGAGNKVQLSGTSQFTDKTNSVPLDVILAGLEACFLRGNRVVMGLDVWLALRVHPQVLDAVKSSTRLQDTPGGFATPEEMITLLEIQELLIGRSRVNTAARGQAESYSRIWGNDLICAHVESAPGIKRVSFGYIFSENQGTTFTSFNGNRGEKGATYIKNAHNEDRKIVAADLGYLVEDAVA